MAVSFTDVTNSAMPMMTNTGTTAMTIVLIAGGVMVVIAVIWCVFDWLSGNAEAREEAAYEAGKKAGRAAMRDPNER